MKRIYIISLVLMSVASVQMYGQGPYVYTSPDGYALTYTTTGSNAEITVVTISTAVAFYGNVVVPETIYLEGATVPYTVTKIKEGAFNSPNIEEIVLPNSLKSIEQKSCSTSLSDIKRIVIHSPFNIAFANDAFEFPATVKPALFVPESDVNNYSSAYPGIFSGVYPIGEGKLSLVTTLTLGFIDFSWFKVAGVDKYHVVISTDAGILFDRWFDANGNPTTAPSAHGQKKQPAVVSETSSSTTLIVVSIGPLPSDGTTTCNYVITGSDETDKDIYSVAGSFQLDNTGEIQNHKEVPTSLTDIEATPQPSAEKFLRNGQILIRRNGRIYSAAGVEME